MIINDVALDRDSRGGARDPKSLLSYCDVFAPARSIIRPGADRAAIHFGGGVAFTYESGIKAVPKKTGNRELSGAALKPPKCVVAIGGSAGALEAFERFIKAIPTDVNAAVVVLQHMDPAQKSLLPELLQRMSELPVAIATDGAHLQPRHIYVIEPGTTLGLQGMRFAARRLDEQVQRRYPIDIFFASLAANFGANAIGVVVSGTGTDGTNGLRLIRDAGGRTLAQLPIEAKFDGMPQSAIAAGVVDRTMPAAEIGKTLAAFIECAPTLISELDDAEALARVCDVLHRNTGHDFSAYKKSTVARRVERRVQANLLRDLAAYVEFIECDPDEPQALLRDLLISVTQFFRDPEAFAALRAQVLPQLFRNAHATQGLRVWVPACATGEEAYTIAILLKEYRRESGRLIPLQIFATDIDRSALEFARRGHYPASIAESMPAEPLARYFRSEDGYRATPELRELCVFSEHNLLKNPPFSRIDLVSCRNLFIYWEPGLQGKTLPIFHWALNRGGFLFLGSAESVAATAELFRTIDKKNRIFQRNEVLSRGHLFFPISNPTPHADAVTEGGRKLQGFTERDVNKAIVAALLEDFAPPAFIVNEHGEIVFYSGRTGKFLEPPTGSPSNIIYDLVRKPLRAELHALLHRCVQTKIEVSHPTLTFESDGAVQRIKITVRPMPGTSAPAGFMLVVFQELMSAKSRDEALQAGMTLSITDAVVEQLEAQLRDTREHLQSTVEQVKSANEELLSMNEELQSANEELQTSKEELQSTNEELETVNTELSKKVEELDASNSDLQNFFNSAQVPIVFLDRAFRVQRFTPAATQIFRLIASDIGRAISDIASLLDHENFTADFSQVLQSLQPIERELITKDGRSRFIMRISPYRTLANVIDGVTATFTDITELKKAQESKSTLAAIVESSSDAIISRGLDGNVVSWNAGAERLFLFSATEAVGKPITQIIPPDKRDEYRVLEQEVLQGRPVQGVETERVRKDGVRIFVSKTMSPIRDANGKLIGLSISYRDNAEKKRSEAAIARSHEQLVDALESMGDAFFALDREWRITRVNSNQERVSQTKRADTIGKVFWDLWPTTRNTSYWAHYHRVMEQRIPVRFEEYHAPLDVWTEVDAYPTKDGGIAVFFRDVTRRKKSEQEVIEANEQFRALAEAMPNLAWIAQADGFIYWYNQRWYEYTGTTPKEMEGWGWQSVHSPDELPRVMERWTDSIATGAPFDMTFPLRGADGQFRWFLTRVLPMKNSAGTVLRWFGTNTDVDEQRKVREALTESERRLSFALAAAKMGTYDWDVRTGRLIWSEQTARLHGLEPEEFRETFEHAKELTHPDDHARVIERIEASARSSETFEVEYRVIWPRDKSIHWHYAYGKVLTDDAGNPVRSIGAMMDITARKHAERALQTAVRTRDEFLSIASHELKTPLTSLRIQTQMRLRELQKGDSAAFAIDKLRKMIEGDERQINRLTRLIDDMLDVARISSGKLTVTPETVDLGALVHEVCERLAEQVAAAGCTVAIENPEPVVGQWDRFRIEQVVTNLITNAIKYGDGKPVAVHIGSNKEKGVLVVKDRGRGIPKVDHERIFLQFERAVGQGDVAGLGLGLYIVRQILAAHGGSIRVESEIGAGASFIVELPLRSGTVRA